MAICLRGWVLWWEGVSGWSDGSAIEEVQRENEGAEIELRLENGGGQLGDRCY